MVRWVWVAVAAASLLATNGHDVAAESAAERQRARDAIIEMRAIENRQRDLIYQQQQQRYREQDRRDASQPLQRPEVPVMRPGCAPGTSGSRFSSGC